MHHDKSSYTDPEGRETIGRCGGVRGVGVLINSRCRAYFICLPGKYF